jgi:hypothetical protein
VAGGRRRDGRGQGVGGKRDDERLSFYALPEML